jgi:hypothetical protein
VSEFIGTVASNNTIVTALNALARYVKVTSQLTTTEYQCNTINDITVSIDADGIVTVAILPQGGTYGITY